MHILLIKLNKKYPGPKCLCSWLGWDNSVLTTKKSTIVWYLLIVNIFVLVVLWYMTQKWMDICVFDSSSTSVDRSWRSLFLYWFLFSFFWPLLDQIPVSGEFLMINWFLYLFVLKWYLLLLFYFCVFTKMCSILIKCKSYLFKTVM